MDEIDQMRADGGCHDIPLQLSSIFCSPLFFLFLFFVSPCYILIRLARTLLRSIISLSVSGNSRVSTTSNSTRIYSTRWWKGKKKKTTKQTTGKIKTNITRTQSLSIHLCVVLLFFFIYCQL